MEKKGRAFRWRRWLPLVLLTVGVAACLVVELGGRLAAFPVPGWRALYEAVGLAPSSATAEEEMEVHFLSVGNGDCTLIRRGEAAVLIDGGEPEDGDRVVDYLCRCGVDRLELVVATHGHADHVGGLPVVLDRFPVDRLLVSHTDLTEDADAVYGRLLSAAAARGVPTTAVVAGDVYTFEGAKLHILWPAARAGEENDRSVVARLTYGERAFLFTGDAGTVVESALQSGTFPLKADVLKISHHGGNTATTSAFLRAVAPSYGVIPCGVDNSYGHPSPSVLMRLQELGITCLRSDVAGDVVFVTDGDTLTVRD